MKKEKIEYMDKVSSFLFMHSQSDKSFSAISFSLKGLSLTVKKDLLFMCR